MKTWITSDSHFFHKNIVELELRPEDHNEQIIKNWNALVSEEDTVIHLGDYVFKWDDCLRELKGNIILVRGNHDKRKTLNWLKTHGITFVCDSFTLNVYGKDLIFTHKPLITVPEGWLNVHGHCHSLPPEWLTEQHRLFTIEHENYMPVQLHKFLERK